MSDEDEELDTIADLIAVIKVLEQTVAEVRSAQDSGSGWYTKGHHGLYQIVRFHLDKADQAIKSVKSPLYPLDPEGCDCEGGWEE